MRINNNLMAMNAHRYLTNAGVKQSKSLEKISSGLRINSAADDAAGLAISEKMRAQISGLEQAETNAQNGISLIQTAEGALNETHSILQRMRQLAVDSSNDTNTAEDRAEIQKEIDELSTELSRISDTTEFNTEKLLNGEFDAKFHIGANSGQEMELAISDMSASELGVEGADGFNISDMAVITGEVGGSEDLDLDMDTVVLTENNSHTYTASALNDTLTLGSESYEYALKDSDDNVVALSSDGKSYTFLDAAGDGEDVNGKSLVTNATVDFGEAKVISGDVTVITASETDADDDIDQITAIASQASVQIGDDADLSSGTYTVVGDQHQDIGASAGGEATDLGLLDSDGNLVGFYDDSASGTEQSFTSYNDSSVTLFTIKNATDNALEDGESINIESDGGIDVSTQTAASSAITTLDDAITTVSGERSKLGAYQNRLEHTINNLATTTENLQASESRIRDVDVAKEMMEYTKLNILAQASQSMLAQANQAPQGVLQLLG